MSDDLSKIDVSKVPAQTVIKEGRKIIEITLDKTKVTEAAMKEIMEYVYVDRVSWDSSTDKTLIQEVKNAAQYLVIERLVAICDFYLGTEKATIPESVWWKNMKWAFDNLRTGDNSLSDLTLVCKGGEKEATVTCHACILCAASKFFYTLILGEVVTEESKSMKVVLDDATESQMLAILKYIYTKEFEVDIKDLLGVWILSNRFVLEDFQTECESMIQKISRKKMQKILKKLLYCFNVKKLKKCVTKH